MRALNSRRPPIIILFCLFLLLRSGEARSVQNEESRSQTVVEAATVEDKSDDRVTIEKTEVPEQVQAKQVAVDEHPVEDKEISGSVVGEQVLGQDEDSSVAKKRRRNDVAVVGKSDVPVDDVRDEGIRRFDVQVETDEPRRSSDSYEESRIQQVEDIPSSFRKSGKFDGVADVKDEGESKGEVEENEEVADRAFRSFSESQSKSRRKSSTVYLNAEEKKVSDGQQQSIVDGQIKKLISIRDDVLDAQKLDKADEGKGSKREIGLDEVAFVQQGNKVKNVRKINIFEKWRDQAIDLQSQIRDRTFLSSLKEQAIEILPDIPKLTEKQLLEILERIVESKNLNPSNESFAIKDLTLTDIQLRIIRCAQELIPLGDRQTFDDNLSECIRGLSVLNCIRIFVWPVIVNNIPTSVVQNLSNLPFSQNVIDLFQVRGQKSGRSPDLHRVRLITPDVVVYNILQDALESYPNDETLISYIDPKNETLNKLLTSNQLSILQMGEKFLPEPLRREYSDRIFSCVRRFEYFSCVKYFAWPLIKQYFPALPAFPDYQSWYPIIDLTPQYPVFPFPSFSEELGELPEVVDADATRIRRPRPEAIIIQVLQNTLKEQPRISSSPSFLDQSADTYATLIPQDQLLTINMAEQLIPISYRPEFVQKTVRCMKEYNYLTCIKYSAWPTVRQFIPTLPDISSVLPDLQVPGLPDIGSYLPEIPAFPDLSFYWPVSGTSVPKPSNPTFYTSAIRQDVLQSFEELEIVIEDILKKLKISTIKPLESSPVVLTGNTITFTTFTKRQIEILRLAESLVPLTARATLITDVLTYLQRNNNFIDCARYVIWPSIARYIPNLPEFPNIENKREGYDPMNNKNLLEIRETITNTGEVVQERFISDKENKADAIPFQDKESRNRVTNIPVISVSGTRFVPIFTEQPETVIFNILRAVQLQSFKTNPTSTFKNQQFLDLITEQQGNILNIVDALLPENVRPDFANKMIECLRVNNFLICTKDIVWPMLTQYFPWLPSFPNFGIILEPTTTNSTSSPVKPNITETDTPSSETDVKTVQHGDTTVTITDTRFYPIYNELPETIVLNILKAVQLSVPNQPGAPVPPRMKELSQYLTEQQINIVQIAENLLHIPARSDFIDNLNTCLKSKNFLECTRDVTWPTLAQSYPWLPSFPYFGTIQNLPQSPGSSSIRFQVFLSEKPNSEAQISRNNINLRLPGLAFDDIESKIEKILLDAVEKSNVPLGQNYLNLSDPIVASLSERERNIIILVERLISSSNRQSNVSRFLECRKRYNFVACTNNITWPVLQQILPSLPDIASLSDLFTQFPGFIEIPADSESGLSTQAPPVTQPLPLQQGLNENVLDQRVRSIGNSSNTPSVGNQGAVPGYAGQPPILIDVSNEKVQLPSNTSETKSLESKSRNRRDMSEIINTYYETEGASDGSPSTFPNITESEYLQLLIQIKENARSSDSDSPKSKHYLVDSLNSTIRNALTADQYEILKLVEDLEEKTSSRGVASQVVQCLLSLSFIRCVGIFVWPLITSNLPSLLPSLPSFGILGRSLETESQVQEFFDMSTDDFERELMKRKETIESQLLGWYKKLSQDEFQFDAGFLKIKGYGNNKVGISLSSFREGRGAKLKDNKNLPSILTIISDIMEEVLDPRPEEKPKRDKDKKERSIDNVHREADIQFLKDSMGYLDIKRSMSDDEIIAMFLNKIKSNDSEVDGEEVKYFDLEDAYNAFGVLFGTKLHDKLVRKSDSQLRSLDESVETLSLESQKDSDELKVLPLGQVSYDFEKESSGEQEERQRQKRGQNLFKSFLEKGPGNYLKDSEVDEIVNNKINVEEGYDKETKSGLIIKLPNLDDQVLSRKMTNSMNQLAKAFNMKMSQMMPGFGLILSFLIQMGLAHARAAASMAGMISNIALGSAMFGMIRDSFLGGSNHPQIKYVYDNDKVGPGITWPTRYDYRGY